ncbi:unnamed protein product [Diplocarpon coronariae]|nr:hypothetical protein JHW43_001774 [Diplocarpon mali]
MIKIKFAGSRHHDLNIPKARACAESKFFLDLCEALNAQDLSAEMLPDFLIFGIAPGNEQGKIYELFRCFMHWLYTAEINQHGTMTNTPLCDVLNFGNTIEAPAFLNAAFFELHFQITHGVLSVEEGILFARADRIKQHCEYLWARAVVREYDGCFEDAITVYDHARRSGLEEMFWEKKKVFLFALDCAAWLGIENAGVRDMLRRNIYFEGATEVSIDPVMLTERIARFGREQSGPPWSAANYAKYITKMSAYDSDQ